MSPHTPGPRRVSTIPRSKHDSAIQVLQLVGGRAIGAVYSEAEHLQADAELFAAGPEMLEALMAASLHLMVRPENRLPEADKNVAEKVRVAIARARGDITW